MLQASRFHLIVWSAKEKSGVTHIDNLLSLEENPNNDQTVIIIMLSMLYKFIWNEYAFSIYRYLFV